MMKRPDSRLCALAYQVLEQELKQQETMAIDAAVERVYQRLYDALVNLVGTVGFQALLLRASHLTGTEFCWLEEVLSPASTNVAVRELAELARQQRVALTIDGMASLLANLIGLLCTFLGEDLTMRLVRRTWTGVSPPDAGLTEDK